MNPTAISQFETSLVAQIAAELARRPESHEVAAALNKFVLDKRNVDVSPRQLATRVRLAIKAQPAAPTVEASLLIHARFIRTWAGLIMPHVMDTVMMCNDLRLPVPVIFSCEKYLATARLLREDLQSKYCGVEPIIVCGDPEALEETTREYVLRLPVDDTFEGLPIKVFEAVVFFHSLGANYGLLKLDDDVQTLPGVPLDAKNLRKVFRRGDYIGRGVSIERSAVDLDRTWHFGKCHSAVAAIYGGRFKGGFAGGALYMLSVRALRAIYRQQLKYPGCLAGELYEDKAVGDALRDAGIKLIQHTLGPALQICVEGPERIIGS